MAEQQRWAEIAVDAAGDAQEIVGALLLNTARCQGYATTEAAVTGYLPVDERLENTLLALKSALADLPRMGLAPAVPDITIRFVAEADWANAWKQYFKPQTIGRHLVVKPTWEAWENRPGDVVIAIDPGMAFGTGLHATTRLCLQALENHVRPGLTVADVGTGSGILAVAAALLGAERVAATDLDPLAVRIARENVVLNGVADQVDVAESSVPPVGPFGLVVANILADVIIAMTPALFAALAPGGRLIASGIIDTRADNVADHLAAGGFTDLTTTREGEWAAVEAVRPAPAGRHNTPK
jgi:ribosomal protein L11 methyltransferase